MAYLVPAHWRRFPRTRAQINRAHFFAHSLTNFWSFGSNGLRNLVSPGPELALVGSAALGPTIHGVSYLGAASSYANASGAQLAPEGAFTFFAYAKAVSFLNYGGLVGSCDAAQASVRNELFLDPSGYIGVSSNGGFSGSTDPPIFGDWHLYIGGYNGTARFAYVDGIAQTLASISESIGTGDAGMQVGSLAVSLGTYHWPGEIALAGTLNRAVTATEASEFGRNFCDIYAPVPKRIYATVTTAPTIKHRRTLSALGTRMGSRQVQGV